jgi:hypothetical protein
MVLKALLNARHRHRNTELVVEHEAEMVWSLDSTDALPYVMLSSLHSCARGGLPR